jgi:hypothetical protein
MGRQVHVVLCRNKLHVSWVNFGGQLNVVLMANKAIAKLRCFETF